MRLEDKRIIITGGASGIGQACVRQCSGEGARVVVLDREAVGGAIAVDVADEAQVERAVGQAVARLGGLDAMVHCAGIPMRQVLHRQDSAGWDEVHRVNVRGTFLCAKYALPHLQQGGGAIVLMASVVGVVGMRNRAAYSASKGAVIALTRNMALDYAPFQVRVNCICPGFTRTPMTEALFADAARVAGLTALHPLGRLGEPDDIAGAVVFLLSDEANWITGVALPVDGGFTAGHAADV